MAQLRELRLTLLVGNHAQIDRLGRGPMTERVRNFRDHLPAVFPLPHPSWRSQVWMKRNPWFEEDVLPALRMAVRAALA
jgi:uracil-DNA glycosylase